MKSFVNIAKNIHNFDISMDILDNMFLMMLCLGACIYYSVRKEYGNAVLSLLGVVVFGIFLVLEYSFLW